MSASDELRPYLPEGCDYAFTEDEFNRLWRARRAASLLAAINNEIACSAVISEDSTAAVAEYIAEDLLDILLHAHRLGPAPANPQGPDLI